ncbi:GNAT family N-acetyltransferase [Brevibacillus centrosporus]|uniref:GNAT family N-acetyltransferase n=1 Tax=Brevibacillus centrosporus TaxID=54910 RepID=UPI0039883862
MSLSLTGERLVLRETIRDELPQLLNIYNSNPGYNQLRNGFGIVTLAELETEYDSTMGIPSGYWLTVYAGEQIVGIMHLIVTNPADQKSWISLLLIHANFQRKGYGREAVQLAEGLCASEGSLHVHHGVYRSKRAGPAVLGQARLRTVSPGSCTSRSSGAACSSRSQMAVTVTRIRR